MVEERFVGAARRLMDALDQQLVAARPVGPALLVRTREGLLFIFLPSAAGIPRERWTEWIRDGQREGATVVILTPDPIPPEVRPSIAALGARLVDGERLQWLIRQFDLEPAWAPWLPDSPEPEEASLPTARATGAGEERADRWLAWGVPTLALKFYDRILIEKPEYRPALNGRGWALLALGRPEEARDAFGRSLELEPEDLDARVGHAAARGATGDPDGEREEYRHLVRTHPDRDDLRAHLVAALVADRDWTAALEALDERPSPPPPTPALRCLRAELLDRLGRSAEAGQERARALRDGLSPQDAEAIHSRFSPTSPGAGTA
ncbi:MAG: tetratricopeptide repeat protein [Thermoplasmata archaeon]